MKIKLPNDWPYQFLFLVAVGFSYINNYELSLLVWLIVLFITIKRYYSTTIIYYLGLFIAIVALGCIRSFFYDYNLYNTLRDISYFIKPIVGLLIGYQCIRDPKSNFIKTVIYTAAFISLCHYLVLFFGSMIYTVRNVHDIRYVGGYFSDFETFAIIILLFHKKFNLGFSKRKLYFFTAFIGLSTILYFARTNMIQFFILACGMLGLFQISKRKIIVFLSLCLFIGIGYKIIYDMNPTRNGKGAEAFFYKIKNAPREIYDPYVVNDNSSRFHDNFRSYETKVTIAQVANREDYGVWLGNGFGASVNYGSLMWTNDGSQVRHAPVLHNGYTTVFLKTGITGICLFIGTMIFIFLLYPRTGDPYRDHIKLLLNSTGIFLFISSLVFLGYYLKLDNKSLFVGGLIAYYEILSKTNQSII